MHSLPLFHRIAGAKVVVVGGGDMADAKRRLVERAGGMCVAEEESSECRLAFVAVEQGADAIAERLRARGLLVNVADRPDLCDFTLPSVLERGDVLVAVSTGGASAGLAKQLRLRLETFLPSTLGDLARALGEVRGAMRARWPDARARRAAVDSALAQGGPLDVLAAGSHANVASWLEEWVDGPAHSSITIKLRSMDPDDLTLREARLLGTADLVLHDRDVAPEVLTRARADARRETIGTASSTSADGLTIRLLSPPGHTTNAWFHYTRRAGRFTAMPVSLAGWITLLGTIAISTIAAIAASRWAMQLHPAAIFLVLPLCLSLFFTMIYRIVTITGRQVD